MFHVRDACVTVRPYSTGCHEQNNLTSSTSYEYGRHDHKKKIQMLSYKLCLRGTVGPASCLSCFREDLDVFSNLFLSVLQHALANPLHVARLLLLQLHEGVENTCTDTSTLR